MIKGHKATNTHACYCTGEILDVVLGVKRLNEGNAV